jgi:hypothetical protein
MEDLTKKFQRHMHMVWELSALAEESLSDDDQVLAEIMQMHPEYYDLWSRLDEITDDELAQTPVNPVLHVLMHQIIENQIAGQTPPQAAATFNQLIQQGFTRHEAIHQIGKALAENMQQMIETDQNFTDQRYAQTLRQLVRPRRRRRRRI